MRLLLVSSWFPYPLDNGSRVRAYHLLHQLSQRHSVTLLSFGLPDGDEQFGPLAGLCERIEVVPSPQVRGRRLSVRGLLSPVPRYYRQAFSNEMRARVEEEAGRNEVVLGLEILAAVHVRAARPEMPTIFEGAEAGAVLEGFRSEANPIRRLRRGLTWQKFRWFLRSLVRDFDWTTVVSENERRLFGTIGCDVNRVTVVPNGTALHESMKPFPRKDQVIYPGSVAYSANLDAVRYFIKEVFPRLRHARPRLEFLVTGATDGVDISDLSSVEGVTFTGRLTDVRPSIAESLACVVPLRQGGGTRLKVLEAMAVGTPVVSTWKGVEGLDFEAGRHLLLGDSPGQMVEGIVRLAAEPAHAHDLAVAARQLVADRYSWKEIGRSLERVVQVVTDRHG